MRGLFEGGAYLRLSLIQELDATQNCSLCDLMVKFLSVSDF